MIKSEKARELFSAYWEGTLDSAMRQQMDRSFGSDSSLLAEYKEFVRAMEILEVSAQFDVPVPEDLHERISARLDLAMYEKDRQSSASDFLARWRQFALLGGLGIAIVGGYFGLQGRGANTPETTQAGPGISIPQKSEGISLAVKGDELILNLDATSADRLSVLQMPAGTEVRSIQVSKGQKVASPLRNTGEGVLTLVIKSSTQEITVALPGTKPSTVVEGNGTVSQFAEALAAFHGKAVQLEVKDRTKILRWTLNPNNVTSPTVSDTSLSVELEDGIIRLHG